MSNPRKRKLEKLSNFAKFKDSDYASSTAHSALIDMTNYLNSRNDFSHGEIYAGATFHNTVPQFFFNNSLVKPENLNIAEGVLTNCQGNYTNVLCPIEFQNSGNYRNVIFSQPTSLDLTATVTVTAEVPASNFGTSEIVTAYSCLHTPAKSSFEVVDFSKFIADSTDKLIITLGTLTVIELNCATTANDGDWNATTDNNTTAGNIVTAINAVGTAWEGEITAIVNGLNPAIVEITNVRDIGEDGNKAKLEVRVLNGGEAIQNVTDFAGGITDNFSQLENAGPLTDTDSFVVNRENLPIMFSYSVLDTALEEYTELDKIFRIHWVLA